MFLWLFRTGTAVVGAGIIVVGIAVVGGGGGTGVVGAIVVVVGGEGAARESAKAYTVPMPLFPAPRMAWGA